jgi:hypothetical protein
MIILLSPISEMGSLNVPPELVPPVFQTFQIRECRRQVGSRQAGRQVGRQANRQFTTSNL